MGRHLITGAGSGIGAALAEILAEQGDELLLVARSQRRADEFREQFPGAQAIVADLADPHLEARLAEVEPPPSLDSMAHVAGVVDLEPVADLSSASLARALQVNLIAPAVLTRWALPALRAGQGTALFVNSTAVLTSGAEWAAYAASKAGLRAFADVLRAEEAGNGVRVCTLLPSRTATPMQQRVREQEGGDYDPHRYLDPVSVAETIVSVLDLPPDSTITELVLRPTGRR